MSTASCAVCPTDTTIRLPRRSFSAVSVLLGCCVSAVVSAMTAVCGELDVLPSTATSLRSVVAHTPPALQQLVSPSNNKHLQHAASSRPKRFNSASLAPHPLSPTILFRVAGARSDSAASRSATRGNAVGCANELPRDCSGATAESARLTLQPTNNDQ